MASPKARKTLLGYPQRYGVNTPVPRPMFLGNIDLNNRPHVQNPDGSISTVRSMSYGLDNGREVLIPTVSDEGVIMDGQQAAQYWANKGQHLGVFTDPYSANDYAVHLHNSQARMLEAPDLGTVPTMMRKRGKR